MSEARSDDEPLPPEPPPGGWWSDEPQMETDAHATQMMALIATLRRHWRQRRDFFVGGNLTIYYSPRQRKSKHFRGPDVFVALGVDADRERKSWVVWEEGGKYPNVIFELISETTEHVDRGEKVQIYQDVFRTPEYFLFDPESLRLDGLRLVGGRYQPIAPDEHGRLSSEQLELSLAVRDGSLRVFTRDGALVPTPDEAADAAEARIAELERELASRR